MATCDLARRKKKGKIIDNVTLTILYAVHMRIYFGLYYVVLFLIVLYLHLCPVLFLTWKVFSLSFVSL